MISEPTVEELAITLSTARTKARSDNPDVRIVSFGVYEIKASAGGWHTVKCGFTKPHGHAFVACSCLGSKYNAICYHAYRAFVLHIRYGKFLQHKHQKRKGMKYARVD